MNYNYTLADVNLGRLGQCSRRYNKRGGLPGAEQRDRLPGQLRILDDRDRLPALVSRDQLPDRHQHVHRRDPRELLAGHRGRAGRFDGRRLRHVLRDLAAIRSGRHAIHQIRPAVGLLRCIRAPVADT